MGRQKKEKPIEPEVTQEPVTVEAVNSITIRVVSLDELKELERKKLIIGYNQVTKEAKYREAA